MDMPMKGAVPAQQPQGNGKVEDIMAYVKDLVENQGLSEEQAKQKGLEMMMMQEGDGVPAPEGEVPAAPVAGEGVPPVPGADVAQPPVIDEEDPELAQNIALMKAKKASGGKMKPNFNSIDED